MAQACCKNDFTSFEVSVNSTSCGRNVLPQNEMPRPSEFEINRELQLPRNRCAVCSRKRRKERSPCSVELIEPHNVHMVEEIKRLDNKIELSVLTDFEVLEDSQVQLSMSARPKRVSS